MGFFLEKNALAYAFPVLFSDTTDADPRRGGVPSRGPFLGDLRVFDWPFMA